MSLKRIDPPGCACTDCLTGYSSPIDAAALRDEEVRALIEGRIQDATGGTPLDVVAHGTFQRGKLCESPKRITVTEPTSGYSWSWTQ